MECLWCGDIIQGDGVKPDFCSNVCANAAGQDYELYLTWYNDYMSGYEVPAFEKIRKKPKRKEDQ